VVKQSVLLQNMLKDLGGEGEGDPHRCHVQCDMASLTLVMRLMAADTSVDVDMTRAEMVVALRLMHFLDIPWAPYGHLTCSSRCSSSGLDAPSVQVWVELVQLDRRATEFLVYKSIWDVDGALEGALAGALARPLRAAWAALLVSLPAWEAFVALFGRHGSGLLSATSEYDIWRDEEVVARVQATTRWVRRAAGIAGAEDTFVTLAVEMLAAWVSENPSAVYSASRRVPRDFRVRITEDPTDPVVPEVPEVTWLLLQALALGAVREGTASAPAPSSASAPASARRLARLARAAAALLPPKDLQNCSVILWHEAFDADFVAAIDLWDGVVGSNYDVFLRIRSPQDLVRLAVNHGHALRHDVARKWLALVDRPVVKIEGYRGLNIVDNLLHAVGATRLLGPRMPLEVAALVGSRRFPLSTLRCVLTAAIGRNGLWYGFAEGLTVVLDAFRDRFRDPQEPDGDPTEREFLEDLLAVVRFVRTLDPPVAALGLKYVQHMLETTADPAVRSQLAEHLQKMMIQ
jgi:hypothetical protein